MKSWHYILIISIVWYGLASSQSTDMPPPQTEPQLCPSGCHCDFQTRVVSCQHGSFTSIPTTFPSYTTTLILGGNIIRNLFEDSFVGLPNLASLDLTSCEIAMINPGAFNGLDNLRILNLQLNHLNALPPGVFQGLKSLRDLNLQRNNIQMLPSGVFNDTPVLQILDTGNNQISQIQDHAFDSLPVLTALHLTYNQLASVPEMALKNLTNLKYLSLSGNPISTIPSRTFNTLTSLDLLYLDNMQLSSLEQDSLAGLQSVTTIDLSNNQIRILDPLAFLSLSSLETLILAGNLWNCECSLFPFVQWLTQSTITYYSTSWFCTSPSDLHGNLVYVLQARDFACEPVITNPPINTIVEYRQRVHFECIAKGDPTPDIEWYRPDGTRISAQSNSENVYTALNGIVLVIQVASEENAGIYKCTATNVRGSDSVDFQVVVNGIPEPEATTVAASIGSDVASTDGPPSIACTNFILQIMLEDISDSSIHVGWTTYNGNEQLSGYVVQSHTFGDEDRNSYFVNWTATRYQLTNLESNTGYIVCAAFLLENCPLTILRQQCLEVTTLGENPAIAAMRIKHRNEIIGTALAGILITLFIMASVFLILWRYRKPKKYSHYDFKGTKDTAAFAGIPEDIDGGGFIVSEGMSSGSKKESAAYTNGGLDMSADHANDYSSDPVANNNTAIKYLADVHSSGSANTSQEDVTDTTASLKSAPSVVSDDGLREAKVPKDKPSKVKRSRPSLSSHESMDSGEAVIELTNLGIRPHHSNGTLNAANEVAV